MPGTAVMRTVMPPLDTVSQALLLLVLVKLSSCLYIIKQPTVLIMAFPMIYPQLILGYWDTDGQVR